MAIEIEIKPGYMYPQGTFTEAQIRDMVGAPTREEEEMCVCGEHIDHCPDAYDHMTNGH